MDRRTRKTKQTIKDVFLSLLENKMLTKITVSEIINHADISRGTFYLHYKDVYDLYDQLEDEIYAELEQLYDKDTPNEEKNIASLTASIIKYISDNKSVFLVMFRSETNVSMSRKLRHFFVQKLLRLEENQKDLEYAVVESTFTVAGIVGVIEDWLTGGMKETPHRLTAILQDILGRFY